MHGPHFCTRLAAARGRTRYAERGTTNSPERRLVHLFPRLNTSCAHRASVAQHVGGVLACEATPPSRELEVYKGAWRLTLHNASTRSRGTPPVAAEAQCIKGYRNRRLPLQLRCIASRDIGTQGAVIGHASDHICPDVEPVFAEKGCLVASLASCLHMLLDQPAVSDASP